MNLLLDTHTLIWFFESDEQLSKSAKSLIENPENQNYFSVASIWEMVIKQAIGKLQLNKPVDAVVSHIQDSGIKLIDITSEHTLKVGELEMFPKDPFDRLIISQSMCMNYPIVGKDDTFDLYPIKRIW
jgi:PIN domain nuclease of toxin-antitoxin system